jgi:hypothetical protein
MESNKQAKQYKQVGRKPSKNPSKFRYTVNMDANENARFQTMLLKSGVTSISGFISNVLLGKEIKVVKIDKATMDYYIRLTNFYAQFQAIGNNYNQTVAALKTNFGERRVFALLYKLEKTTIELILLCKQIIALTQEYEKKYLKK